MAKPEKVSVFNLRIPRRSANKRYSILKFNGPQFTNMGQWPPSNHAITMSREDNRVESSSLDIKQEFGEGSEYGKAAREEARRKKYGRQAHVYQHDNQPWVMKISESNGKERKFRSIREGGAGDHADYWLFMNSGKDFIAHKVDDWYKFLPFITHRTLDIDEAEEKFKQRDRIMNQFALKAQIQQQQKGNDEEDEKNVKTAKSLKIKDEMSSSDDDLDENDSEKDNKVEKSTKKNKKPEKPNKEKKQRVENGDEVAAMESDDGDDEGREYDYITDSGSDSDRDVVTAEQKVDEALVAVGDEKGLRKLIDSDVSDSDESVEEDPTKKLLNEGEEEDDEVKKRFQDLEERDSSGSDSDDPDNEMTSAIFLPAKKTNEEEPTTSLKRPLDDASSGVEAKRPKIETSESAEKTEGLTEEAVRRYLRRKPHTTKELLSKFKSKCVDIEKTEIVQKLAHILKKISPHQFKQKQGKKEVLFFSLCNTVD